ncbi:hypothetical protein [Raoultella ornithinolytica]|uniref:hypothetical protein n=1 Tax=Raoultella ornithinolytica TaxID=54291 RepID=UPI00104CFACC
MDTENDLPPIGSKCLIDLPYGKAHCNFGDDFPEDGWEVTVIAHLHNPDMVGTDFEWYAVISYRAGNVGAMRVDMCRKYHLIVCSSPLNETNT